MEFPLTYLLLCYVLLRWNSRNIKLAPFTAYNSMAFSTLAVLCCVTSPPWTSVMVLSPPTETLHALGSRAPH